MDLKFFYVLVVGWIIILLIGEPSSELESQVNEATIIILVLLGFAVRGLAQRIDRATKAIKPDFDVAAADRHDWVETVTLILSVLALLVAVTVFQGGLRCLGSDEPVSPGCLWSGFLEQVADDFS